MKRLILISLFFIISCDTVVEKDLYTRNDPEWNRAAALQSIECIESSLFLQRANQFTEFDNANYEVGDTYQITQDTDTITYVQIMAINADNMVLRFNSSNSSLIKEMTFTEVEATDLVENVLEPVFCSPLLSDDIFSSSGLSSETRASFVWDKETITTPDDDDDDDIPEIFSEQRDSLTVNLNFPLFFYFYNGTKRLNAAISADQAAVVSTATISIIDITDDEDTCDDDARCDFVDPSPQSVFTPCELEVNSAAVNEVGNHEASFLEGNCILLQSNGVPN